MATRNQLATIQSYGRAALAHIRFTPGATPVILEGWGIKTLTHNNTGDYTVTVLGTPKALAAIPGFIEDDTTHWHEVQVTAISDSARTVRVRHRSVAYASFGAPTASDTVDALTLTIYERCE